MLTEIAKYRILSGMGEFLLRLKVSNVHPSRICNFVIAQANDKYAWIVVETSECIFLNDFWWNCELIAWKEFIICVKHDLLIFATGKEKISYIGRYQATDDRETEMMSVRWKYFEFKK